MAAADQIKSLIKSFGDGDESRFFATALQIAATEARKGHSIFAQELKSVIEKARKERSLDVIEQKAIPLNVHKRDLQELIEVFHPKIKLNNMVLDDQTLICLNKVIKEQEQWQVLKHHNLEPKRKLLLTGAPGTGKTMTAQAIAGELGLSVYIIRLDGLISKYLGESIAKLRLIFDAMSDHRAVYLFDEFDSIGSHRNLQQDVGEIKRVLNSFLINIEKDSSNSIIVAATNLPESLDSALFRRFDDIIQYPLPDEAHIASIIKKTLSSFKFDGKINYKELSKKSIGLNYSEIVKACQETIKDMILSGSENLQLEILKDNLMKRQKVNV
ncbi:SpoVK/Ycf46/Vps4 family AAA+-type ATPase [Flavobacterium nitrogenifigens]|uniref:SpoVK/Ycf46/Vps4 family AAA+-type ATPase n=2 Tax=Flavobacterium TaxID=237 RepID=A0A7W7IWZ6_9FLAO|nr:MULTISPECIES: AAA family ATPase [Flavobacterium]MBB4802101.1 SpoVK/Ycf46/Vps4 family AAA+-type ATPase [Flavobacterium nitrogenifigens]MBB6387059.1 SpoVK/Ycf46/Vps4 family AAA+-type ATPase [Flavobacterium notoginsengisoli]